MHFSLNYSISESDYLDFINFHHENSDNFRRRVLISRMVVPAIFVFWIILQYGQGQSPAGLLIMVAAFVAFSILWIFFLSKQLIWRQLCAGVIGNIRLELDDTHICQSSDNTNAKITYFEIEKIAQTSNAIYIYASAIRAFIIPFTAFESEEGRNEFLKFLHTKQTT